MHTDPDVLALVALGEREAASSEDLDHIAHCETCGREVTELGHLTEVGRTISDHFTLETPNPQVWDRIRAQLGIREDFSSELVPPPTTHSTAPRSPVSPEVLRLAPVRERRDLPPQKRRRILSLALAAALALLAGIGGTLAWQQLRPGTETVVAASPLNAVPPWSGASGEAKLEEDADGRRWLVVSMTTPQPVTGVRQVWLMNRDASAMTPIGLMARPEDRFPVPENLDLDRLPVVDISDEEPAGPATHSGNSIVRGTLPV